MATVEFDADKEIFQATFDTKRDAPYLAALGVVATALNRDLLDLSPLYSSIETDRLEWRFLESPQEVQDCDSVTFCYEGFEVTVSSEGLVEADPMENTSRSSGSQ
jgi:hypothetical protein